MAITTCLTTSFKQECLQGIHDFETSGGDTIKIALIKVGAGSYGPSTANYSALTGASDEVASGGGYTTGGATITVSNVTSSGTTAWVSFSNVSWSSATFSTIGALVYNSSKSNKSIALFDFGGTQSCVSSTFQIVMPADTSSTAIIRIS
jgi:hypothetical protein